MVHEPAIRLFDGIADAELSVEVDQRELSALVTFTVDGRVRWSMSIWLDNREVDGFILRCETTRAELVVRNLVLLDGEPMLRRLLEEICQVGGLVLPQHPGRAL
jgi:hypothetical protein